jgi:hypothetical protein
MVAMKAMKKYAAPIPLLIAWAARAAVAVFVMWLAFRSINSINPQFLPHIDNAKDSFQFQIQGLGNLSPNVRYTWKHTGNVAAVEQGCSIARGKAMLVIHDGAGKEVYSHDLGEQGTFYTEEGTEGKWTIQVLLTEGR